MGRGRVEVFDDGLRRQLAKARRIGRTLGRLLREPRLPIRCSPIADLHSGEVVGFDCAVDWDAAGIGEDPATVARVVDDDGMSRDLDIAIVRTMLAHLSDWELRPPGPIVPGLSVTLTRSGALSPLLPEVVREMLERSGVAPARCWFGIPEAAVARDLDTASRVASALDALGAGVALRDFGSAISSLEQLRRLPAPTTTIAGPLVAAVAGTAADDDAAGTLLAAVVRYAVALGRIVVAFDVQDAEHARRLRELGCSHGSGPAFGPRLRPGEIPDFLAERGVR
jgi:EAL domain-containing protein (putative c-di-GMP-specific phosphodiesterase class I)